MNEITRKYLTKEILVLAGVITAFFLAAVAVAVGIKFTDTKIAENEYMALRRLFLWIFGLGYAGYLSIRMLRVWFERSKKQT